MPTLEQATDARLSEIYALARSGVTEMTGKARREYPGGAFVGRFGGMKPAFPELEKISDTPAAIAKAIERGEGKVFERVYSTVEREMSKRYEPARRRSPGKPTVPPHEGRVYCVHCRTMHTKGQHRFHGAGSFHRTHLFSFKDNMNRIVYDVTHEGRLIRFFKKSEAMRYLKRHPDAIVDRHDPRKMKGRVVSPSKIPPAKNPMTVQAASKVFADLMKLSRARSLTTEERAQLSRASQIIRYQKRKKYRVNAGRLTKAPDVFKRYLEEKLGYLPYASEPHYLVKVYESHMKDPKLRRAFEQWQAGGSLLATKPTLFENRRKKKLTRSKARLILHHGEVRGHKLTAKQRAMFGARASGYPVRRPRRNGGEKTRMGKLVEIRYLRDHGRAPGYYKHEFKSRPTIYYTDAPVTVPAGAIVILTKGKS